MLQGRDVLQVLKAHGVSHVVWLPDSHIGCWDEALRSDSQLRLIRVTREGEAIGVAAGLMLGGKRPVVMIQCTGLFEAGDALRNVVYDLRLPLFLVVGIRSWLDFQAGIAWDSAPRFALRILDAWQIPYTMMSESRPLEDFSEALDRWLTTNQAGALLIPE
ncbi:MAG: thiamine pyrophosphate-binding protein [Gemmatales bacterium]|nr:thiamine pyrophosphate-binding protein [Gemmatales bacterium]MDW8387865.1 thiamine pyrophosphate-binding protein [Gemmatales bacterium]